MKTFSVKKGYRLSITTWENDGDDYSVQVNEGLDKPTVQFLIQVAQLFKSCNDDDDSGFGNEEQKRDWVAPSIMKLLMGATLPEDVSEEWIDAVLFDDAFYVTLYNKILGHPVGYEYQFCRVFESFKVEYISEDVKVTIPVKDVTEEFE